MADYEPSPDCSEPRLIAQVEMTFAVDVEIPDDLIDKVFGPPVENQNEDGTPQPYERGGEGWRNNLYDLDTIEKVLQHLTYNGAFNNLSMDQMEGWLLPREEADRIDIGWPDIWDQRVQIVEDSAALDRYRRGESK